MRKLIAALVIVGNLIFSSTADAEIKTFTATGEEFANKIESKDVIKLRALDDAIKNAIKLASDSLKTSTLTDDEISTIIFNNYQLVGQVRYSNEKNKSGTLWRATIDINFDDAEIKNWLSRDDKEKFVCVSQFQEAQKLSDANDSKLKDLRENVGDIRGGEEKLRLKKTFGYIDNEFLSNQKLVEGNKFAYKNRYEDAIKLYTDAIALNEDNAAAYNWRGNIYNILAANQKLIPDAETYRRTAIADLDKAIRFNPSYGNAYSTRGFVYYCAKNYSAAKKDFDRAIQLEPAQIQNYIYRGQCLRQLDKNLALADFNKAVELAPKNPNIYATRGDFYEKDLKYFSKAAEDYSRAIELETKEDLRALHYQNRGDAYHKAKMYGRAIDDYSRAISMIENQPQKNPLLAWIYRSRGECYQALGNGASAQADLKKFEALQRKV